MDATLGRTIELLEALVAFPSISHRSNLDVVGFIAADLQRHGIESHLVYDATGERANLFATIGPQVDGGVVLSGHTDVVPTEGQDWLVEPFGLTARDGLLYGRGTTDMKGFVALALALAEQASTADLSRPLHLAFTYDEEPGSLGAPDLARFVVDMPYRPAAVIVGEPTGLRPVAGHKGGLEMTTRIEGFACHSSDPRKGVDALRYAMRFMAELARLGRVLEAQAPPDSPFDPPASTINVGLLQAGTARNVVPNTCQFDWELRLAPHDDGAAILAELQRVVDDELLPEMRARFDGARIETEIAAAYPGLRVEPNCPALALARALGQVDDHDVVPFGTDAGCFQRAGLPTVVMGPGHIDQAHKPNEFIAKTDLAAGLVVFERTLAAPGGTVVIAAASPTEPEFDAGAVRRRIGLVALATDLTLESDFAKVLGTAEVGLFTTRIAYDNPVTETSLRAMAPKLEAAARLVLPGERLDAVAFGCTAASAAIGDAAVAAAMTVDRPGTPCVTPTSALRAAATALGLRRLSVLTPYTETVSRAFSDYLRHLGLEVVSLSWLGIEDDRAIAKLTPATIEAAATAACDPEAEALFCSCTALRAAGMARDLERSLQRPVLTSNQVLVWQALRQAKAQLDFPFSTYLR